MAMPLLPSVAALSSNVQPASSNEGAIRVKEERPDDAEINELAAKMVEANKAKLAAASTVPLPRVALGQGILGYLSKNKQNQPSSTPAAQEKPPAEKPPLDIASQKGKFGWIMLGEEHIPYIIRGEDKYCAVRMVELKLLAKYLNYLNADIYSCTCIRSYYITEAEARLLTEINIKHCECRFGREQFSVKDLVVRLQDASEFYNFLDLCYTKLLNPLSNTKERCGFIRINCDSVVPYTIKDGKQYVPLFYFEGETDNLKQKADKLESWDLAYLKFCCKVQGIRSELFASETCSVISLADIKSYFPHGTVFDEYWPPKVMDSQLLITPKNSGARTWLKVPPGAATTPTSSAIVPNKDPIDTRIVSNCQVSNGWPSIPGNQQRYQSVATTQQPRLQATPISMHSSSHSNNSITRSYGNRVQSNLMGSQQYYPAVSHPTGHAGLPTMAATPNSHLVQATPPPLVRVTSANPTIGYHPYSKDEWSAAYSAPNMSVLHHSSMPLMSNSMMPPPHMQYPSHNNNNNTTQKQFPPPLIPVNGSNQRYYHTNNSEVIDLSSPPQSPQRSILANGKQSQHPQDHSESPGWKKLIPILESPPRQSNHYPFKMQKALVSGKMVPCINAKPYVYSELLMTVNDLIEYFFPQVPISKCREVLQNVLQVSLYSGNLQQMTVLRDNNKCKTLNEVLPLIQLKDVVTYMPQMRYILERHTTPGESASKRQRIS